MATKLEKYIWLVDTLRRSGGLTLEELGRAWDRSSVNDTGTELTVRSFRRYCREIEDRFGIRIRCDRHDFTYTVENHVQAIQTTRFPMQESILTKITVPTRYIPETFRPFWETTEKQYPYF